MGRNIKKLITDNRNKLIVAGAIGAISYGGAEILHKQDNPNVEKANIAVYFSPQDDCVNAVVYQIGQAKSSIYVQAYSFTCPEIWNALVERKDAGVKVEIILDHDQEFAAYSLYKAILNHKKIPLYLDKPSGGRQLAHNKIIIIDEYVIITGSYNFTKNARKNAENLLIIVDKYIASLYVKNFHYRKGLSRSVC